MQLSLAARSMRCCPQVPRKCAAIYYRECHFQAPELSCSASLVSCLFNSWLLQNSRHSLSSNSRHMLKNNLNLKEFVLGMLGQKSFLILLSANGRFSFPTANEELVFLYSNEDERLLHYTLLLRWPVLSQSCLSLVPAYQCLPVKAVLFLWGSLCNYSVQ